MAKGERRYKPPQGYITSTQAIKLLGKSLYKHVDDGRIRKIAPAGHKQGFYHEGDVRKVLEDERKFGEYTPGKWRQRTASRFERAREEDMPAIIDIDARTFPEEGPAASLETCTAWWRKNPDTFYVLRYKERIVGYASALPLSKEMINSFIRDEIDGESIGPDDIPEYEPGRAYDLYVMAIAIDPDLTVKEKHKFGASLTRGIASLLLNLARHGIDIRSISARSYKADGIRMLTGMGIPWLRSPVPHKNVFVVNLHEAGYPLFVKYSDTLAEWQAIHTPQHATMPVASTPPIHPLPAKKRSESPVRERETATTPPDLLEGTLTLADFAAQLGISRTTLLGQVKDYNLEHTAIPKANRPNESERYFTPDQQQKYKDWRASRKR